jgi:hypothetical protein
MASNLDSGRDSSHEEKQLEARNGFGDQTHQASNGFGSDVKPSQEMGIIQQIEYALANNELPPDPDAGLSEEEKAKIVRAHITSTQYRRDQLIIHAGPQVALEARPQADPLGA